MGWVAAILVVDNLVISLSCARETNVTLCVNRTQTKKKKIKS